MHRLDQIWKIGSFVAQLERPSLELEGELGKQIGDAMPVRLSLETARQTEVRRTPS